MRKTSHAGFTLVELLAVIAIVLLLAAILIPTIGHIRRSALESSSLSNMRQVGLAYVMVAQDNSGVLPSVYGDARDRWDRRVNALLTDGAYDNITTNWTDVLQDPVGIHDGAISEQHRYHFAPLSAITRGNGNNGVGAAPKALRTYNTLLRHANPNRQILLADAGVDSPDSSPWGDLLHAESFSWSGNWNGRYNTADGNIPIDPGTGKGGDIRWDKDGNAKFFFLDGHVEKRHQSEVLEKNVNPLFP